MGKWAKSDLSYFENDLLILSEKLTTDESAIEKLRCFPAGGAKSDLYYDSTKILFYSTLLPFEGSFIPRNKQEASRPDSSAT